MEEFEIQNKVLMHYNGTAEDVTIPDGVEKIGEFAFSLCRSLKSVTIPASVKEIAGDKSWRLGAFHGCESLEHVVLSEGLEIIGPYSFYECKSLKSITIPSSVKEIGEDAFHDCDSLGQVVLSEGLEKISGGLFVSAVLLKQLQFPHRSRKLSMMLLVMAIV